MSRVADVGLLSINKTSIPSAASEASEFNEAPIHVSPQWEGIITVSQGACAARPTFTVKLVSIGVWI